MNNNYLNMYGDDYLAHYGVKGQKWGHRKSVFSNFVAKRKADKRGVHQLSTNYRNKKYDYKVAKKTEGKNSEKTKRAKQAYKEAETKFRAHPVVKRARRGMMAAGIASGVATGLSVLMATTSMRALNNMPTTGMPFNVPGNRW